MKNRFFIVAMLLSVMLCVTSTGCGDETSRGREHSSRSSEKFFEDVPPDESSDGSQEVSSEELPEEPDTFSWQIEPSIEADDIIVPDCSYDVIKCDKRNSDVYSFIERDGKFNAITYDGRIVSGQWYLEPRIAEMGDMGLYFKDEVGDETGISCMFENEWRDNPYWTARGGAGVTYYKYPYDRKTSKIYLNPSPGESSVNNEVFDVIVIQESDVTPSGNYFQIDYNGKFGIACENKVVVEPEYDDGIMNVYNDMVALKSHGKWGFFNGRTGEQVIDFIAEDLPAKYSCKNRGLDVDHYKDRYSDDRPYTYYDGYVVIASGGEYALYDENGQTVIDFGVLEEIRPVHNGLAWAKKDGKWGVINIEQ